MIRVLKRAGIPPLDLVNVYLALVRSVLEYCCVTWSNNLPGYLKDRIEMVQKRAMRIIFPGTHYRDALTLSKCSRLNQRRNELCYKVLKNIEQPDSRLHHLLPPLRSQCHKYNLRNNSDYDLPKCRTDRFKKSFFPAMAFKLPDAN